MPKIHRQILMPSKSALKSAPNNCHLVFLHDALGSIEGWRDFPQKLADLTGLPALLYDRVGSGQSGPLQEARTIEYLKEQALNDLPVLLKELDISDVILFGHSDGANIALYFAGEHFESVRIRGVVSQAAHIFVEEITLAGIHDAIKNRERFIQKLEKIHGDKTEALFDAWTLTWTNPKYRNFNCEAELQKISCPVLAIQGVDDEYATEAHLTAIQKNVSGPVETLYLENCAHFPHYQQREQVLAASQRFIFSCLD